MLKIVIQKVMQRIVRENGVGQGKGTARLI